MRPSPVTFLLSAALACALAGGALAGCAQRGVQEPGWVALDGHHRYQAVRLDPRTLRLRVATLHAAGYGDGQELVPEAMAWFRRAAVDLGAPSYNPDVLIVSIDTTPSEVRIVTVSGVVSR
jgi:hypothetical protein